MILCTVYNSFSIPFDVAFNPPFMKSFGFIIVDIVIDAIFYVDVFITFRSVYIDQMGKEIVEPKLIALNYVKGMFWIDMGATLPLDSILKSIL